ncbi:MAG: hypothetical protein KGQ66_13125 [Acidobacteriota bacterium]|nr:hypothetical protein [Acidobacteriota bacterium]
MSALATMAAFRLEDGRRWGDVATELQKADARAVLEPAPGGPRRHWLGRAKGYSKTGDTAAMSLAVLLEQLRPGAEAYAAATDADQAGLLLRAMRGFVNRTPGLSDVVRIESKRVVVPSRGTELVVLPADSAGANGLKPGWLVVDELCNWSEDERHREFFETLWAGLAKVSGSRGIVMSTAGAPGHFSERYFEMAGRERGWRRSDVKGPSPWMGAAEVEEQRRTLMPGRFARWFMNEWVGTDDRLASWGQLRRAAVLSGPQVWVPGREYFVGVDLGLSHDRTAIAVVHTELAGVGDVRSRRFVVDRLEVREGSPGAPVNLEEVERVLVAISEHYRRPVFRFDPWQAELLIERLRRRGLSVEKRAYSAVLFDQIATQLAALFREDLISIPADGALLDELATVKVTERSPGRLRIDTRPGGRDDRAMALGYAVTLASERLGSASRFVSPAQREAEFQRMRAVMGPTFTAALTRMEF